MNRATFLTALLATTVAISPVAAQGRGGDRRMGAPRPGAQQDQRRLERRAMLEQRFRQRLAGVVRDRLQLSDDQMARLQATDARMQQRRRPLMQQEREVRMAMRAEMARGGAADQSRVSALMAQALTLQRQRQALVEDEQKELSAFLTPVQRVQYGALQAQLRRRVDEMQAESQNPPQLSPTP